jgi:hypothetical protein
MLDSVSQSPDDAIHTGVAFSICPQPRTASAAFEERLLLNVPRNPFNGCQVAEHR